MGMRTGRDEAIARGGQKIQDRKMQQWGKRMEVLSQWDVGGSVGGWGGVRDSPVK